jgi:predicted SAM-dependent methyltransferase
VVLIEFKPGDDSGFIPEPDGTGQAGLTAIQRLANGKCYEAICRTQVNLICVTNELAPRLADTPTSVKLNLGAGALPLDGYQNRDIKNGFSAYPLGDYPDSSVDEVRASHLLEHFPHREVGKIVKEWARVLKPGGRLKIAVPDFDWIHKAYSNGQRNNWMLEAYLFGGQVDADDFHKTLFNEDKLRALLEGAGLVDVRRWKPDAQDCSSLEVSLNLEGRKP